MERFYNTPGKWKEYVVQVISFFLVLLFTYAALNQLTDLKNFEVQLKLFPFISSSAGWLAWVLPLMLVLTALLFLFNQWQRLALFGSFILMLLFSIYLLLVLGSGHHLPCSCKGILPFLSWKGNLVFNLIFSFIALWGFALTKKRRSAISNV